MLTYNIDFLYLQNFNSAVTAKYNTAKAHSLGVVEFIQSEPVLWQRCGIVAAAALTGVIAGYRREWFFSLLVTLIGWGFLFNLLLVPRCHNALLTKSRNLP